MKISTLHDLFVDELRDLYSAENQILKALPKMIKAASCEQLRAGFQEHLEQTRGQVVRLEQIFDQLDVRPKGKRCVAMKGIIEEGAELIQQDLEPCIKDAGLVAAAQKVEHYEIAGYGCVITWAEQLGEQEFADLLEQTLNEEKQTDKKLTQLAEQQINASAKETVPV